MKYSDLQSMLRTIMLLICGITSTLASGASSVSAESMAERMLTTLGGRSNWAALKNTVNDSQQYRVNEPVEVRSVITMDFTNPRWRIDTTGPGLRLIRAADGDKTWRLNREGKIETTPEQTRAEDARWHAAHLYRTIHRIAKRDQSLVTRIGSQDRLEIFEGERRLLWLRLNAAGEPFAFGAHQDETGSLCGPWKFERNGIKHPTWTALADGSWRATLNALQTNVTLDATQFAMPTQPELNAALKHTAGAEPTINALAGLIGSWSYEDASTTIAATPYRDVGTRICAYALQDQYIRCESKGKVGERERNYVFYFNYNKIDRRFEMVAMHSDYSRKSFYNVSVHDEGKRIELITEFNPRDDSGSRSWSTITFQSPSKMTWETRINRRGQAPDVWLAMYKDVAVKQ